MELPKLGEYYWIEFNNKLEKVKVTAIHTTVLDNGIVTWRCGSWLFGWHYTEIVENFWSHCK